MGGRKGKGKWYNYNLNSKRKISNKKESRKVIEELILDGFSSSKWRIFVPSRPVSYPDGCWGTVYPQSSVGLDSCFVFTWLCGWFRNLRMGQSVKFVWDFGTWCCFTLTFAFEWARLEVITLLVLFIPRGLKHKLLQWLCCP